MSLHRKQALQALMRNSYENAPTQFPSLFQLAIHACVSSIHIFATFEGLPFRPFGKALFQRFVKESSRWALTAEQRQIGILLFAETYGEHLLGPEYSGIKCSLSEDLRYLGILSHCLVYLDLSGGPSGANGFVDADMTCLATLRHLRILDLATLEIGDVGLSHLIRSVTFGSGPAGLEYLNLAATNTTTRGLAKLFIKNSNADSTKVAPDLVFKHLLGIDLTGLGSPETINALLQNNTPRSYPAWMRLDGACFLFPAPTLHKNDSKQGKHPSARTTYTEKGEDSNPMLKWVERLGNVPRIGFGKRPDLAESDGMGLGECLALAKLGQVHMRVFKETPAIQLAPQPWINSDDRDCGTSGDKLSFGRKQNDRSKGRHRGRGRFKAAAESRLNLKQALPPEVPEAIELKKAFDLTLYHKVLDSIRSTSGSYRYAMGNHESLAFVRDRTAVQEWNVLQELNDSEQYLQDAPGQTATSVDSHSGIQSVKIKPRHQRPQQSHAQPALPVKSDIEIPIKVESIKAKSSWTSSGLAPEPKTNPFAKRIKLSESSLSIKKEDVQLDKKLNPFTSNPLAHLPVRRKVPTSFDSPFVKPWVDPSSSELYVRPTPSTPTLAVKGNAKNTAESKPKPGYSLASLVSSKRPVLKNITGKSASKKPRSQRQGDTVIREFHFDDGLKQSVSLDRWIRTGSVLTSKGQAASKTKEEKPSHVIRFDSTSALFKDLDSESPDFFEDDGRPLDPL